MLPATSAPPIGPAASAIGKLNGLITPHTPYGRSTLRVYSLSDSRAMSLANPSFFSTWVQ